MTKSFAISEAARPSAQHGGAIEVIATIATDLNNIDESTTTLGISSREVMGEFRYFIAARSDAGVISDAGILELATNNTRQFSDAIYSAYGSSWNLTWL